MNHIDDLLSFASQVAEESNRKMQRLEQWENHITPMVESRFGMKYNISLDGMYRKELQDFINEERIIFDNKNPL